MGKKSGRGIVLVGVLMCALFLSSLAMARPKLEVWFVKSYIIPVNETFRELCKEFETQRNVNVDASWIVTGDLDHRYVAAIEAGATPDVGCLYSEGPMRYHALGQLLDVSDVVEHIDQSQGGYSKAFWAPVRFGGKFYGVPFCSQVPAFYYRKDKLAEAGLSVPATWEEFRSNAIKLTDPEKGIWGTGMTYNRAQDGEYITRVIPWAFGAKLVEEDGVTIAFNSPEMLEGVRYLKSLYDYGCQPPGAIGWTDAHNNEAWLAGKICSTINGGSIWWKLKRENHPLKGVTELATPPAGPRDQVTNGEGMSFVIFKNTKEPELAKDLLKFIMKSDNLLRVFKASGGQDLPITKDLYEQLIPLWKDSPNLMALAESMKYARFMGYAGPLTPAAAEICSRHIFTDMMVRVIVDGLSPENAIEEATQGIKDIYAAGF